MKLLLVAAAASTAAAFSPSSTFGVRNSALQAEFDLDFGSKNDYVPASAGDGGQGQFGAVSPNDWRVPGTSPVGEKSYAGASDGGAEPWFSEAVSTVSLDLKKAEDTLLAFTKEAAQFKIDNFAASEPFEFTSKEAAMDELVGAMGYSAFLEATDKQLAKQWDKLHPEPKVEEEK
mmetsp:Transcript_14119/g.20161  ORF Transcript_14119/g.20161 Transcript_14119/m.20161 type:complete len:175 (+) Transcript_14119:109-633(+)|eukprot:CAMPEP_0184855334 /NCGR_PEP_ID=MMETSP0580-20130426/621_1 /TAXON_ID=1118495 /ORGANISM="Dactyliosolen fragilissimus" /LENGTH=174 /DNA_ID=CAMNT_0027349829 /DNA_START=51 /DNA_END=575 /DNA_ORIENTATION=-